MSRPFARGLTFGFLLALAACSPFDIKTPPSMIELKHQTDYAFRAMTPDGVVIGVRVIGDAGKADVAFWSRAVALHMNELSGYALLGTSDVTTQGGVKGQELRFGHDERGKPYAYVVRVFVDHDRLFLVEAGGTKDEVEKAKADIAWAMDSLRIK
jgi:hypothetical protein